MASQVETTRDTVVERKPAKLAPPPMYQVVLLNDDYTPMDFVIVVVQHVFGKSLEEASRVMLKVHHEGRGVVGVYTRDIAATRVEAVMQLARMNQHPLQCIMEPVPAAD
jgi:ATP-dependent Clp protease adaptor protein ClpS